MMKGQKGITLVALIITIIVMLILVAVTISVALNGGLFANARKAARDTKGAQVREAMALAKAEVLADYYEAGGIVAPTADNMKTRIERYLDGMTVTMGASDPVVDDQEGTTTYTVTPNDAQAAEYFAEKDCADLVFDIIFASN